jgi:DNA-binding CsgD family transcriptional regulator
VLVAQSLRPADLVRALPDLATAHARQGFRRVQRGLTRGCLTSTALTPRLVPAVLRLVADAEVLLVLDSSRCGRWEVFTLGVRCGGRVLPVGWQGLPYPWPKGQYTPTTLRWPIEAALLWVRWGEALLCLTLPLLFPVASPLLAVLLALGLALGNAVLTWLMRQPECPNRLRLVSGLATGLEWAVALGMIGLLAHRPMSNAPAGLLLLVPLVGLRYGWPGLLVAGIVATASLGALTLLQLQLLPAFPPRVLLGEGLSWVVFLALTLAMSAGVLAAGHVWRRHEERRWQRERANLCRLDHGLTFREWQLLGLLADAGLTYSEIGARSGISGETVKAHARRIGTKLNTSGRVAIVTIAHEDRIPDSGGERAATRSGHRVRFQRDETDLTERSTRWPRTG